MIEARAIVVRVDNHTAYVKTDTNPSCERCAGTGGCGAANLTRLFCTRSKEFAVINRIGACPGERVTIGIVEAALLKSSLAVYILPLILLIGAASIGTIMAPDEAAKDIYAAAGALIGIATSAVSIKLLGRRFAGNPASQPMILTRHGQEAHLI